ncbi:MAG: RHS repeat-associated core domain-containing protein [Burkholderiales bacterium]
MTAGNGKTVTYTSFNMVNTITSGAYNYTYTYNAEHQRARLITVRPDDTLTSIYAAAGFYEKETSTTTGEVTHKFYVQGGAGLVGVQVIKSTGPPQGEMRYYHTDNLGSIATITNEVGGTLEQMAYEMFGERRYDSGDPQDRLSPIIGITTDRGYTGHEHLDEMNLIHMNGRVFDPALGRFMTADPFINHADNMQDYNRYGYCMNNPVICTDPSGYKFKFSSLFRTVAAIAVAYFIGVYDGGLFGGGIANAANAAAAGFAGGTIQSGTLQGGIQGAFSGLLFYGAGQIANEFSWSLAQDSFGRALFHAGAGCISAAASGGDCGRGAATAGFTKFVSANTPNFQDSFANTIKSAVIGGTASAIGGGKFANGAVTGAFQYIVNYLGTIHYTLTVQGASQAGWSNDDARILARRVSGADWDRLEDGTHPQEKVNSHMHAMCASEDAAVCGQRIQAHLILEWSRASLTGLARVLHWYQDQFAGGHGYKVFEGLASWSTPLHVVRDALISEREHRDIVRGTATIIREYMKTCPNCLR